MEKNIEEKNAENISFISKSEQFIEKNQKTIIAVAVAIVVIVLAIFGIKKFVSEPRQQKANEAIFAAEQYFAQGDYNAALYGDSASTDQAVLADHRPVQHHRLDADQRAVADRAAMQHHLMADRHVLADGERGTGIGVQHGEFLDVAAIADHDRLIVAA